MIRRLGLLIAFGSVCLAFGGDVAVGQVDLGNVALSGRVHRVVMLVEDGASSNVFFIDSEQAASMLRVDAALLQDGDWTVTGAMEVGIQSNPGVRVSQDDPDPGTDLTVRTTELGFEHARLGKARFGRVVAAAWAVREYDLSGTVPSALLATGMLAPGMKFVERSSGELSDVQVLDYFLASERLLLTDGVRYDSPRFGGGGRVSGTYSADQRWDAALRYYPTLDRWSVRAIATYQHRSLPNIEHRVDLGASVRHEGTGLNLTGGLIRGQTTSGRDAQGHVLKAGWVNNVVSLGATALSIDYSIGGDAGLAGDEAESIGLFAQQSWDAVQVDFYAGYRTYHVTRPDIRLNRLHTVTTGVMLTF